MEIDAVNSTGRNVPAAQNEEPAVAAQPAGGFAPNSAAMFSAAPGNVQAGGQQPETAQLNLRIRADLYRQLDRVSVLMGVRRGAPVNRVTIIEEALAAYFEANRTS
jgi:hypothetical protein